MITSQRSRSREEGSALIVVLLFTVLVILMVGTLLMTTTNDLKGEYDSHKTKALSVVLRTALQDATYEINRHRLSPGTFDPGGDGVGALGTGLNGAPNGIRVVGANGQLLGLYRTTVQQDAEGLVIRAVAVLPRDPRNPDFVAPRRAIASKLLIGSGTLTIKPTTAFELPGGVDPKKFKFEVKKDSTLNILSGAPKLDETVPAINIANKGLFDSFVDGLNDPKAKEVKFDKDADVTIAGMDSKNPGTIGTGADAVANKTTKVWTEEAVKGMSTAIYDYVELKTDAAYASAVINLGDYLITNVDKKDIDAGGKKDDDIKVKNNATIMLPDGVYEARKLKLEDDVSLIGTGTLIVSEKFEIKDRSKLEWYGDIIVVGEDGDKNKKGELKVKGSGSISGAGDLMTAGKVSLGGDDKDDIKSVLNWTGDVLVVSGEHNDHFHKAEMKVEKAGNFYVDGTVAVAGYDKEAKFEVKKDGDITIDGALMILSGQEDDGKAKAKIKFDKGGSVTVNGLLAAMGTEIKFEVKKDETLTVNGSTVLLLVEEYDKKGEPKDKSKLEFKIDKDGTINLIHDFDNILAAATDLELFYAGLVAALGGTPVPLPLGELAYWEIDDPMTVMNEQQAAIAAGTAGFPE